MAELSQSQSNNGSADRAERHPLDLLADEFLDRLRRGEHPSISEYVTRHPELAEDIQSVFPTLAVLEKGGEGLQSVSADPVSQAMPQHIGEYALLAK